MFDDNKCTINVDRQISSDWDNDDNDEGGGGGGGDNNNSNDDGATVFTHLFSKP